MEYDGGGVFSVISKGAKKGVKGIRRQGKAKSKTRFLKERAKKTREEIKDLAKEEAIAAGQDYVEDSVDGVMDNSQIGETVTSSTGEALQTWETLHVIRWYIVAFALIFLWAIYFSVFTTVIGWTPLTWLIDTNSTSKCTVKYLIQVGVGIHLVDFIVEYIIKM